MEFVEREFIPVILGGDINTYSIARSFYEEYQVEAVVVGKLKAGPSYGSKIVHYIVNEKIDQDQPFLEQMSQLAEEHSSKKILLFGASDSYVNMIAKNQDQLSDNVIVPSISFDLMDELQDKDSFYDHCERLGIAYPDTLVVTKEMGTDFEVDFTYPVILKPSDRISYDGTSFTGKEKVYTIESREELDEAIAKIYDSGYSESLIVQDMIPGNDENMYVLTAYSDQKGQVKMMCLGHVLLEEHTPTARGNHAVIITEHNEELMEQARSFLETINYKGLSNFDIKYDTRDGKYKFFEINTRQGRSSYYVTGAGRNIAKYIVEDYIYHQELEYKECDE